MRSFQQEPRLRRAATAVLLSDMNITVWFVQRGAQFRQESVITFSSRKLIWRIMSVPDHCPRIVRAFQWAPKLVLEASVPTITVGSWRWMQRPVKKSVLDVQSWRSLRRTGEFCIKRSRDDVEVLTFIQRTIGWRRCRPFSRQYEEKFKRPTNLSKCLLETSSISRKEFTFERSLVAFASGYRATFFSVFQVTPNQVSSWVGWRDDFSSFIRKPLSWRSERKRFEDVRQISSETANRKKSSKKP